MTNNGSGVATWWRHQMETFSTLLAICAGKSPVPVNSPHKRPVTRSFDVYFDLRLNKRLCKQAWGWWLETLLCPLWCHRNDHRNIDVCILLLHSKHVGHIDNGYMFITAQLMILQITCFTILVPLAGYVISGCGTEVLLFGMAGWKLPSCTHCWLFDSICTR